MKFPPNNYFIISSIIKEVSKSPFIYFLNLIKELEENLDELMQCVEKIVDYNNIQRSDVSMSEIEFVENVKPIVMKKQ